MAMLNRGISYITFFFLISCTNSKNTGNLTTELKSKSKTIIGESNYDAVLNRINDTILSWKLNRLRDYTENESQYRVDSLLCFNTNRNRLITCLIGKALIKPNPTGGITFMLGEKISNEWYFFKSSHIFIPYELKKIKDGEPFEFEELLARIRVQLKTRSGEQTVLKLGDVEMNLDTHRVFRNSKEIELTPKEFSLLEYLIRNKEKVCTRTNIIEHVWDIHFDSDTSIIDVYINFLRKKLNPGGKEKELIHTIRGVGYITRDK